MYGLITQEGLLVDLTAVTPELITHGDTEGFMFNGVFYGSGLGVSFVADVPEGITPHKYTYANGKFTQL